MKNGLKIALVIGSLLLLALSASAEMKGESKSAEIKWYKLDEAMKLLEADTTGKHMFVHVTASWCKWCRKMENETYTDPEVAAYMNENFIPVQIWSDKNDTLEIQGYRIAERDLAFGEFKVQGYPGFYIVTPNMQKFEVQGGYKDKTNLMRLLTMIATKEYEKQLQTQQPPDQGTNPSPDKK